MVLTRGEKRALLLLLGCFAAGAALYFWREGSFSSGRESVGEGTVRVSIGGAVLNPIKAEVPAGTRLEEVVRESLPLEQADMAGLPLGKKLSGDAEFEVRLKGAAAYSRKLNLNTASPAELEKIPGIGPQMALNIVEARESKRKFYKVEELKDVKGIGEKKFETIRQYVEIR